MRIRGVLLVLLVACVVTGQARANIDASLDTSQIAAGDTVQLTLEHDGRTNGQPDLAPLQRDFDILSTSSSTSIELVNGSASEKAQVVLTLAPKVAGQLTIPALFWDGQRSQPLSLSVTGPGGAPQAGGTSAQPAPNVFMETSVSPERPYVQAAVQLTVQLFTAETLYHADLELPESGDVVAKQVGSDENSQAERNGRTYQVVTRRYLLFPLHSGKLSLQGPMLDAELAVSQRRRQYATDPFGGGFFYGPFFRTIRPVRLRANPIALTVRPRPANAVGSYWLPARDVTLTAAWDPAKLTARAGDPVTLDLTLHATGLTAAQLPDLESLLSLPPGLKAYPDQPKLDDSTQGGALVGSRDQTLALIASTPGHYTIPPLTVSWWDTQTNQPRVVTLPGRTLAILPAPGSAPAAAPALSARAGGALPVTVPGGRAPGPRVVRGRSPLRGSPPPARTPSQWEWISIGLAVVWLATLAGWLGSRRSRTGRLTASPRQSAAAIPLDPSKERGAFRAACAANDAHAARAHLLAWATALWGSMPAGAGAIATRIGDAVVAELLRDLDRACYASGAWQGRPLAAALTELPALPGKRSSDRGGLAPLYP
ncbi:MAG TPA: BatD family protein [Steroidobacteraceae bacterium]|jgi:hypothetical protein|nr:BatD family protein [Steroidobacteraceae bacterium]